MFSDEELEALVLGLRWVAQRTDASFEHAAMNALAKIAAVLPDDLRNNVEGIGLIAVPSRDADARHDLAPIRAAIRSEQMVVLDYADVKGEHTRRTVWPIALAFFENSRVLAAWCELRQDFRHFRIDRIIALHETGQRYPQRRRVLMKQWREIEKIAERT
jgi:predicted DNA-binding transcriptional regulator YafY